MARFRIFPVLTDKMKKMTTRLFNQAGKRSTEWFRNKLIQTFGKKTVQSTGEFPGDPETERRRDEIERLQRAAQRKDAGVTTRPTRARSPEAEVRAGMRQSTDGTKPTRRPVRGGTLGGALSRNTAFDAELKKNIKNVSKPLIGHMYFFIYDPKHKKTLPYYDVFPLVIPINYYPDGFLGMNLHYLPYILRAQLLDWLMSLAKSTQVGGKDSKYMQISYGVLKSLGNSKPYEPTIKRYLYQHVKSPFAQVAFSEWENAAFLPVEQFRKANKREVWADSRASV